MPDAEVCCGFGGTFAIKYPEISNAMVQKKIDNASAAGPEMLLAGDLGCLLNIAGKLKRQGRPIAVRHVAEVLAGEFDAPPVGQPAESS
jgi:L-lactate dehydrogenase complex protein LldE